MAVAAVEGCWRGATLRRAVEGRLDEEGVREGEAFELCLAEVRMVEGDVAPARLAQVGAPAHKPHLRVKRVPSSPSREEARGREAHSKVEWTKDALATAVRDRSAESNVTCDDACLKTRSAAPR